MPNATNNIQRQFANSLGQTIGAFVSGVADGDSILKGGQADRAIAMVNAPNAEFDSTANLIGFPSGLRTHISASLISCVDNSSMVFDRAKLNMHMEVSTHNEDNFALGSDIEAEGKVHIGIPGLGAASVSVKAKVSVDKSKRRSTDSRAVTDVELELKQGPPPEGLARIVEAITENVTKSIELNQLIVESVFKNAKQSIIKRILDGDLDKLATADAPAAAQAAA